MPITNDKQLLAEDCIKELEDKKEKVFGRYCAIIKRLGVFNVRQILSETKDEYKTAMRKGKGKRYEKVKLFWWKVKLVSKQKVGRK